MNALEETCIACEYDVTYISGIEHARFPRSAYDEQFLAGEIAVSELKKGDKTEALVVRYECRDGTQRMWISPIVRPKTGGVALGNALEMGDTAEGRFGSLFLRSRR